MFKPSDSAPNANSFSDAQPLQAFEPIRIEPLEPRQLLSAGFVVSSHFGGDTHRGRDLRVITLDQAPAAVQTGLNTDATDHGIATLASDTQVFLGNRNGEETYSVRVSSTGAVTTLTVDQLGDPLTAPAFSKTDFGTLSGTGPGSDTAAADEITKVAAALGLTAPASDTPVRVVTNDGKTTYSVALTYDSTTTGRHAHSALITVDAAGNPAGRENLPFSVLPAAIQDGLNAGAPTGATKLAMDSTQLVAVRTVDGVVLYTTTFTTSGAKTKVTVDSTGVAANLPTSTTTTFGALDAKVKTSIQTLANANGVAGTIADDQSITVYTEASGAVLYSATLTATSTKHAAISFDITITVDSNGNPTVLPRHDLFFGRFRHRHGFGGFGQLGFGGGGDAGDTGSTNSGSNSSTGSPLGLLSFLHG